MILYLNCKKGFLTLFSAQDWLKWNYRLLNDFCPLSPCYLKEFQDLKISFKLIVCNSFFGIRWCCYCVKQLLFLTLFMYLFPPFGGQK